MVCPSGVRQWYSSWLWPGSSSVRCGCGSAVACMIVCGLLAAVSAAYMALIIILVSSVQ